MILRGDNPFFEPEDPVIATEFIDGESLRERTTRSDMKLREMLDV